MQQHRTNHKRPLHGNNLTLANVFEGQGHATDDYIAFGGDLANGIALLHRCITDWHQDIAIIVFNQNARDILLAGITIGYDAKADAVFIF